MTSAPDHVDDPRVSLTPRAAQIAAAAKQLLEEEGVDALSMRNIGARLGIRAASLYEHFADKRAVENAIMAAALYEQGDYIVERARSEEPVTLQTIVRAFREWGMANPNLYRLITSRDLDRSAPDVLAAEEHSIVELAKLVGVGPHEPTFALWAFAHGALDLELNERFPPQADIEAIWAFGIEHFGRATARSHAGEDPSG